MNSKISTKILTMGLVEDFIQYRIRRAGYEEDWSQYQAETQSESQHQNGHPNGDLPASLVHKTLRIIGDEFYNSYLASFDDMTSTINVHGEDLQAVLYKILDVTCETGIEWGRIVGMFVFAAMLSVKAMSCGRTDVVQDIIQWTTDYLEDNRFTTWINQHGGWDGFVQFYRNPPLLHHDIHQVQQFWTKACVNVFTAFVKVANLFRS